MDNLCATTNRAAVVAVMVDLWTPLLFSDAPTMTYEGWLLWQARHADALNASRSATTPVPPARPVSAWLH